MILGNLYHHPEVSKDSETTYRYSCFVFSANKVTTKIVLVTCQDILMYLGSIDSVFRDENGNCTIKHKFYFKNKIQYTHYEDWIEVK